MSRLTAQHRRRRGFGLVNAIVMVATVGMIMSFSAVVLNRAYTVHSNTLAHYRRIQNLQNASVRLHNDAHASLETKVDGSLTLIIEDRLRSGDHRLRRTVRYSASETTLYRTTLDGGKEVGSEQWELPGHVDLTWEIDRTGRVPLIQCNMRFSGGTRSVEPVRWIARTEFRRGVGK